MSTRYQYVGVLRPSERNEGRFIIDGELQEVEENGDLKFVRRDWWELTSGTCIDLENDDQVDGWLRGRVEHSPSLDTYIFGAGWYGTSTQIRMTLAEISAARVRCRMVRP